VLRRLVASFLVLHVAVLGLAASGETAGFRITAHGAKAMGMEGAFAAQADDPSAVYYNPAGITQIEGTQIQTGLTFIHAPGTEYEPFPGTLTFEPGASSATPARAAEVPSNQYYLPTFFVTHKATDRFSLGFGVYTPYGLQLDWPDDWTGRQITTFDEIKTNYFNLVGAYNSLPSWSVSAGVSYVYSRARLSRTTYVIPGDPTVESLIEFDAQGWGIAPDVGTQVRLGKRVRLGANYRAQAVVEHNGTVKFDPVGGLAFEGTDHLSASAKLPLPATFVAGIAVTPTDRWTIEADWDYTHWQSFRDLDLDIPGSVVLDPGLRAANPFPNRRWKNSHIFRVGTEFKVTDPLAVRLGGAYITTPIPDETIDPILPDSDRTALTAGFGYAFTKALGLDVAYEYQHFHERAKNNNVGTDLSPLPVTGLLANGTYNMDAHIVVVQVKYAF
jgi:long-chain fatty acid transport protein